MSTHNLFSICVLLKMLFRCVCYFDFALFMLRKSYEKFPFFMIYFQNAYGVLVLHIFFFSVNPYEKALLSCSYVRNVRYFVFLIINIPYFMFHFWIYKALRFQLQASHDFYKQLFLEISFYIAYRKVTCAKTGTNNLSFTENRCGGENKALQILHGILVFVNFL